MTEGNSPQESVKWKTKDPRMAKKKKYCPYLGKGNCSSKSLIKAKETDRNV